MCYIVKTEKKIFYKKVKTWEAISVQRNEYVVLHADSPWEKTTTGNLIIIKIKYFIISMQNFEGIQRATPHTSIKNKGGGEAVIFFND